MKKAVLLIIMVFSLKSFSQKKDAEYYQKDWYAKAKIELQKSDLCTALVQFYWAYENDPKSKLGKVCLKKVDSLKPIIRENLIEQWKGWWKLKNDESNNQYFLEITQTEIRFYEKKNDSRGKTLTRTEKILFNEINFGSYPTYWELIFADNQIWNFNIIDNIDKNILYTSKSNKVGDYTIKHLATYRDGRKTKDDRIIYKRIK